MLHILNHAATKSLMFFSAGRIVGHYGKHAITSIRGVLKAMPFCGTVFLLGGFALSGFPPFSIFVSELLVLAAAFTARAYWVAGLTLLFLALMFAGLLFHFSRMLFGDKPEDARRAEEPLSVKLALALLLALTVATAAAVPFLSRSGILEKLAFFTGV
jgi:hydrogenase-4 component F